MTMFEKYWGFTNEFWTEAEERINNVSAKMGIDFYSETKTDEKYIECMVELFENGEYEPTDDEIAEYIKEVRTWL